MLIGLRERLNKKIYRKILKQMRTYDLVVDGTENIPESPVIYAVHHGGIVDIPNIIEAIPDYAVLLAGKDNIDFASKCLLFLAGTVFVNRKDKDDRGKAKQKLIRALRKGRSIIIFPEGTWNLSPSKLHLPLAWGGIDIARKAGAAIVPVAQEYFYEESVLDGKEHIQKVRIRFGTPVQPSAAGSIEEQLAQLEEAFATVRWSILEERVLTGRAEIPDMYYQNYIQSKINSFPGDIEAEEQYIYGVSNEFYLFHHINDVPWNERGELMETEEVVRLKKINFAHGI